MALAVHLLLSANENRSCAALAKCSPARRAGEFFIGRMFAMLNIYSSRILFSAITGEAGYPRLAC
jgi:hypothetical protein